MSVVDALIYNFLTMGVIFPWAYLWGPSSFPGGNLESAIWLTFIAQVPISLAYCFLATVLPVTGGDYIYQTRAFGKWGFVIVMSGMVIWQLQWIALSGWLFASLGLAPWLLSVGVFTNSPALIRWGVDLQTPWGNIATSLLLALVTTLFLVRGLRLYVRIQRVLFGLTLAAIAAVVYIFVTTGSFEADLNNFVRVLTDHVDVPVAAGLKNTFVGFLQNDVQATGFGLAPPSAFWQRLG
jgi:hypothetical protein